MPVNNHPVPTTGLNIMCHISNNTKRLFFFNYYNLNNNYNLIYIMNPLRENVKVI